MCEAMSIAQQLPNPLSGEHMVIRAKSIKDEEAATIFALDPFFVNIVLSILAAFDRWIGCRFKQMPTSDGFDKAIAIEAG